jgi:transposase
MTVRSGLASKSGLARKYEIPPTMITGWKRRVIGNMAPAFDVPATAPPQVSQADVARLHAKIGQLIVERCF